MKITNKLLVLILAVILTIPMTVMAEDAAVSAQTPAEPAAAADSGVKTFETQDGVLSIKVPTDNDKWSVIPDDQRWFVMSDGTDSIYVDHYLNGDTLPAPVVAKMPFVQVYQVYFSTANEVFVVTGEVTVEEDMPYVRDAVNSFQVLKYDTKQPAQPQPQPQPEANYGIRDINSDMYCITTDGVNVRESYSTSSQIIGGVSYQDEVFVIGEVTKDGADTGWLKIQFGNGEGYVYDEWFDYNKPSDPERTGGELTLYREDGGATIEIYEYSDNQWRDDTYRIFYGIAEHTWQSEDIGQYFWVDDIRYIHEPDIVDDEPYRTGDEITLYRADGASTKQIYYYSDGQWRDDNYVIWFSVGNSEWDMEGSGQYVWYDDPSLINY